jgi:nucleotide-binding universal stress UspA family protein
MPIASVMVHVDLDTPNEPRVRIARDLAERFGASVIGITACGPSTGASAAGSFGMAMALIDRDRRQGEEHLGEAEQTFRAAMAGLQTGIAWRAAAAHPAAYVAQEGRSADLIIVGASRERVIAPSVHTLDPTELVLSAGRPLLLAPPEMQTFSGSRAVVAWKDTREARRAVADALPLLQRAEAVTVVEAVEGRSREHPPTGGADVAAWLHRHGVSARNVIADAPDGVVSRLQQICDDEGADLIVAGAYGHGRFREWVLGGVTRDLLLHARCCMLLSH